MRKEIIFSTLILIVNFFASKAQDASLFVIIEDSEGAPVERAIVNLCQNGSIITIDTVSYDGTLYLSGFDIGNYILYASYLDSTYQKDVRLTEGVNRVNFEIQTSFELPTIVVWSNPEMTIETCVFPRPKPKTSPAVRSDPFLNSMGGLYMMDGSIPTIGRILRAQPYD